MPDPSHRAIQGAGQYKIFRIVARWSDPQSARNLRACRKALRHAILPSDVVHAEACWLLHYWGFEDCWDWAAKEGHIDIVRTLLPQAGDANRLILLILSLHYNLSKLVILALKALSATGRFKNPVSFSDLGRAVLGSACANGYLETVKVLLDFGTLTLKTVSRLVAARFGREDIVKLCLQAGVNIHARDEKALMVAVRFGQTDVVKLLLKAGSNVHARTEQALVAAATGGHLNIIHLLLDAGANATTRLDDALAHAAEGGHTDIINTLLNAGKFAHMGMEEALLNAAGRGHLEIVQTLLEAGAHLWTGLGPALAEAAKCGHLDVVLRLRSAGKGAYAYTSMEEALTNAVTGGHTDIAVLSMSCDSLWMLELGPICH
ncbi:hypothetical protein HDV00_006686 [Rhizophlyctis rosea]|nr:hypothetical protein HDV00_006686 [Rhizophlyctis rosea]